MFFFYNIDISGLEYFILQNLSFITYSFFSIFLACFLSIFSTALILLLDYKVLYSGSGEDYGDTEKRSPYECGFEPFNDARITFDVKFYLVGILFLIFDLEVVFLFPWVLSLGYQPLLGFVSMIFFIILLTVGFIYEWKTGGLEW